MKTQHKLDNRGFSLVELIVAVLILGIVSGAAIISFSTIYNARVDSASSMVTNVLKQARQKALSMKNNQDSTTDETDVYAQFYTENGFIYAKVNWVEHYEETDDSGNIIPKTRTENLLDEKLCNTEVEIFFRNHDESLGVDVKIGDYLQGGNNVLVYFKKSTGGISKILKRTNSAEPDLAAVQINADEIFIKGETKESTVVIVKPTGRCYEYHE